MEYGQFEMKDDMCMKTFESILASGDPQYFAKVYEEHKSWRKDMGKAISWLFTALEDTGLNETRDLSAYIYREGFSDPHHEVVVPRKLYTWVPLLQDSVYTATFAIASSACLELFGSKGSNAQKCRGEVVNGPQHSILQTVLFPESVSGYELSSRWSRCVNKGTQLPIQGMKIESLKVVKRLRGGSLLLRLSHNYLQAATNLFLPPECEFQEQMDTLRGEGEFAVTTFVRSKVKSNLVSLDPNPQRHPGASKTSDLAESPRERHSAEAEPEEPDAGTSIKINRRSGNEAVGQKRRSVAFLEKEAASEVGSSDEDCSDKDSSDEASSADHSSKGASLPDTPRKETHVKERSAKAGSNARISIPRKKPAVLQPQTNARDSVRNSQHASQSNSRIGSRSAAEGRVRDAQEHSGSLKKAMDDHREGKQVVRELQV